jgi:hypothetical protein
MSRKARIPPTPAERRCGVCQRTVPPVEAALTLTAPIRLEWEGETGTTDSVDLSLVAQICAECADRAHRLGAPPSAIEPDREPLSPMETI